MTLNQLTILQFNKVIKLTATDYFHRRQLGSHSTRQFRPIGQIHFTIDSEHSITLDHLSVNDSLVAVNINYQIQSGRGDVGGFVDAITNW